MRPRRVSEVNTDIMHGYIPQGYIHDNPWYVRLGAATVPFLMKRSGDRGWGITVKWLSGLSLCVYVRTCFVGCLSKAPLFPSRALLK